MTVHTHKIAPVNILSTIFEFSIPSSASLLILSPPPFSLSPHASHLPTHKNTTHPPPIDPTPQTCPHSHHSWNADGADVVQQVDEAIPLLVAQDKNPAFHKVVSGLKAVHPPRNPQGLRVQPANLTKPKQDAALVQQVIPPPPPPTSLCSPFTPLDLAPLCYP